MTRAVDRFPPEQRQRIAYWYRCVSTLEQQNPTAVEDRLREVCTEHVRVDGEGVDSVENAIYWIGFVRHYARARTWLVDQADARAKSRASLQRRLDEAESTHNMSGSRDAVQRVGFFQRAIDAHDGVPSKHARSEAAALAQTRRFVAGLTRSEASDLDIDQLVATLAKVGGVSQSDIEVRADFVQAAQALFEFTEVDDWDDACALGRECLLTARINDQYFVSDAPWQETSVRSEWKGVLLGGSVNQAGGHRRTRGSS